MLISLNWLQNFVKIPNAITPQKLGELLTLHTVEIDDIIDQSKQFDNFVVGKILEINTHPNADKLLLAKVNIGNKTLDIVCGAPNIKAGQMVPVALVGAIMPAGFTITKTKIRGETSNGMLCSAKELELGNDHTGIMILDKTAKIGQKLAEYLNLDNVIYEIDNKSITHRPDLWGHFGMAREISTFLNINNFKHELITKIPKIKQPKIKLDINNTEPKLCQRYMGICLENINIKESPIWMQKQLQAVGVRPINNIVDITNYVMLETGQPLHAFDSNNIESNKIIIRMARQNEKFTTLDNEARNLDKNMLVIADSKKTLALAGIMGGQSSEITNNTKSITLECANFDPLLIRKTSQAIGLRTDSSMRFEKNLDPNLCEIAIKRAIKFILELCPNTKIASELSDKKNYKNNSIKINLDLEWINKRIGKNLEEKEIIKILENLGFETKKNKNKLEVAMPTWRQNDISIREDLLEEITRIHGYNNIKPIMPKVELKTPIANPKIILEQKIKKILKNIAITEVSNYSFVGNEQLQKLQINSKNHISLLNPISSHQNKLRASLVPNLINNIKTNQADYNNINIFEIGDVYSMEVEGDINKDTTNKTKLPYQASKLGIIISNKNKNIDIFSQLKGIVEQILENLNILNYTWNTIKKNQPWADKKICANITILDINIGYVAMLNSKIAQQNGIKTNVVAAEISLDQLLELSKKACNKIYKAQNKYPQLTRDLAFVVDVKILYNTIKDEIINFNQLIKNIELFDVYQDNSLGKNKKSLAFHVIYEANRTLTNEEVDIVQSKLIKNLDKKFGAQIRNF